MAFIARTSRTKQTGTNSGNIKPERVRSTWKGTAAKTSSEDYELISSRCRARNYYDSFYFDPMTFDDTGTSTREVSAVAEHPEKGVVGGVDETYEVLSDCYLLDMADYRISRFIDCWSSYCYCLIN